MELFWIILVITPQLKVRFRCDENNITSQGYTWCYICDQCVRLKMAAKLWARHDFWNFVEYSGSSLKRTPSRTLTRRVLVSGRYRCNTGSAYRGAYENVPRYKFGNQNTLFCCWGSLKVFCYWYTRSSKFLFLTFAIRHCLFLGLVIKLRVSLTFSTREQLVFKGGLNYSIWTSL